MHVLMLGWEFPPFITGGLGTACHGLTKALDQRGLHVTFVLPKAVASEHAAHVNLVSPHSHPPGSGAGRRAGAAGGGAGGAGRRAGAAGGGAGGEGTPAVSGGGSGGFEHVRFLPVEAEMTQPYQQTAGEGPVGEWHRVDDAAAPGTGATAPGTGATAPGTGATAPGSGTTAPGAPGTPAGSSDRAPDAARTLHEYRGDLVGQVERYAEFALQAVDGMEFDVIHAHDWMTYPAGLWIARASGRPLIVHVHSTEFDRSGERINQQVYDIERRGMHGAMRVVAVSQLTKNVCLHRYGVPDHKAAVVYNGVELDTAGLGITGIRSQDKIVLYFGRITFQKGPDYFLRAAQRVLEHMNDVKFVVAGSGDMAERMIQMAADMGIGHKVLFTGFLRGDNIKKVFSLADLYVMPSVSEPFGIAPLEAMGHEVPVLISRSSGVSEVLTHALKVDFWDVDDMANKIIAVLRHPPLSQTLRTHGAMEARRLTWAGAAERCDRIYHEVMNEMTHRSGYRAG